MAFMGLFRPKWKHSDPKTRRNAVKKLADQAILAEIAKTDLDWSVREIAVRKLTDQGVLARVANTDNQANVREAAVRKLTDQRVLAVIATAEKSDWVREAAVECLTDEALLAEIADSDKEERVRSAAARKVWPHRVNAAERLPDEGARQLAYADIATHAPDWKIRAAAVEKLTDQAVLGKIAKTRSCSARSAAIWRISKRHRPIDERKAAVRKLTDQGVLAEIAKLCDDLDVQIAALAKLTDQQLLLDVATNGIPQKIRPRAILKVVDQNALAQIAMSVSQDMGTRLAAVERITEQVLLSDIAWGHSGGRFGTADNWTVRKAAQSKHDDLVRRSRQ